MKKSGLLKILASAFLIGISSNLSGCLTEDENANQREESPLMEKDGDYPGAVVFTYINESFPQDIVDILCDKTNSTDDSFFYVPDWYKREAEKYRASFKMNLTCFQNQIRIPESFLASSDTLHPLDIDLLSDYLRENYPKLNDYDFLAINHLFQLEYYHEGESSVYYARPGKRSFVVGTIKIDDSLGIIYTLPGQDSFAHEFSHLLEAKHKFREDGKGCEINPETGMQYDNRDLMCARQKDRYGNWGDIYKLPELIISEPTAREIGWTE